jgi:NADPH-dependent FMN reductase
MDPKGDTHRPFFPEELGRRQRRLARPVRDERRVRSWRAAGSCIVEAVRARAMSVVTPARAVCRGPAALFLLCDWEEIPCPSLLCSIPPVGGARPRPCPGTTPAAYPRNTPAAHPATRGSTIPPTGQPSGDHRGDARARPRSPARVAARRQRLARRTGRPADRTAVLVATPEYNSSLPGALKNALDWASRPFATNAFRNKPLAVIGSSPSRFGAIRSQAELRQVLAEMGARLSEVELAVAHARARTSSISAATSLTSRRDGRWRRWWPPSRMQLRPASPTLPPSCGFLCGRRHPAWPTSRSSTMRKRRERPAYGRTHAVRSGASPGST